MSAAAPTPEASPHRMLFVRDLLRCEELPKDAPSVAPQLRCFVFGNPSQKLERIRAMGTVARTASTTAADGGMDTVVYLDDASAVIPVVLPRSMQGQSSPVGPSVTWCCDPEGPAMGDVIDVFGTLHSGSHQALEDGDPSQRFICAVGWVKERDVLQESHRALEIRQLYKQQYFRGGLNQGGFGGARAGRAVAPLAQPRRVASQPQQPAAQLPQLPPLPSQPQSQPSQPGGTPLSEDTVLQFLQDNGGATLAQLQLQMAGGPEQLKGCLTSMQENWVIYEGPDGRFCPM